MAFPIAEEKRVYTPMTEYDSATKEKGISLFVTTWMDLEDKSQMEEDKYHSLSLVCGTETSSQIQRTGWGLSEAAGAEGEGG